MRGFTSRDQASEARYFLVKLRECIDPCGTAGKVQGDQIHGTLDETKSEHAFVFLECKKDAGSSDGRNGDDETVARKIQV